MIVIPVKFLPHFRLKLFRPHKIHTIAIGFIFFGLIPLLSIGWFSHHLSQKKTWHKLYVQDEVQPTPTPLPINATPQPHAMYVPILMYHYIEHPRNLKDTFRQKLNILPEVLESQITTLEKNGYTFLTVSDLAPILDGKQNLPPKPVILTFDDGYRDFYTDAFPILKKHHVKATAYIVSGFIGHPNNMLLAQLIEVSNSNLIEIGAHTIHHIDLAQAPAAQAQYEITESKAQLEKILHIPVVTFAYPSGRFTAQTIKFVQSSGFTAAVSTLPGIKISSDNRYTLFRLRPGDRTGDQLIKFLHELTG